LQLHHIAASGGTDHAGTNAVIILAKGANVTWIFIMINDFDAIAHVVSPKFSYGLLVGSR
jgi:hypothetical protein